MWRQLLPGACLPLLLVLQGSAGSQAPMDSRVLTHREQSRLTRTWLERRFDRLLPDLMRREGIDMWLVVSREYNDDPVFLSISPSTTYSSRRRTMLVFFDRGGRFGVERLSIGHFDYDRLFTVVPTHNDGQWDGLRAIVEARAPKVIGVNTSEHWNHADGLSASDRDRLMQALGPKFTGRVRSAELLVVGWLETRLPEETDGYRQAMRLAHEIIAEAFSSRVIVPGVTTTEDVVWWMRQRIAEMGLGTWFHPSVTIQRAGGAPNVPADHRVIERGDLLHADFGLVYLGFATDTQHNAYVLRAGETKAPDGLEAGLRAANRLQDITLDHAVLGASGNQALAGALQAARAEGLSPSIYCHPIGYHGHGAGPPIGMTDYQSGVPVRGDLFLRPNTWHSVELSVAQRVKEWNDQEVTFALEEDALLGPGGWSWIDGRQTAFYLIR